MSERVAVQWDKLISWPRRLRHARKYQPRHAVINVPAVLIAFDGWT
jgi:hypothetical protein